MLALYTDNTADCSGLPRAVYFKRLPEDGKKYQALVTGDFSPGPHSAAWTSREPCAA